MGGCLGHEQLARYVAGLTTDVRAIIEHVERCDVCRRAVVTLVVASRRAPGALTPVEAWLAAHRRTHRPRSDHCATRAIDRDREENG